VWLSACNLLRGHGVEIGQATPLIGLLVLLVGGFVALFRVPS